MEKWPLISGASWDLCKFSFLVSVSICQSLHLYLSTFNFCFCFICLSLSVSASSLFVSVILSLSVSVLFVYIYLSLFQSVSLTISICLRFILVSVCLSIFICLFYPCFCLSVYFYQSTFHPCLFLSVCLPLYLRFTPWLFLCQSTIKCLRFIPVFQFHPGHVRRRDGERCIWFSLVNDLYLSIYPSICLSLSIYHPFISVLTSGSENGGVDIFPHSPLFVCLSICIYLSISASLSIILVCQCSRLEVGIERCTSPLTLLLSLYLYISLSF